MKNYYTVLGLEAECSSSDVRRAYRSRAKTLHPDRVGREGTARFLALKEAYEILISPPAREAYDKTLRSLRRGAADWDYRDFLRGRRNHPESLARLICYDLLHDRDDEAVELFEEARRGGIFSLRAHLDREDFMDYSFLLAEAYLEQDAVVKGYRLLRGIADLEEEHPYFKHFYPEVLERLSDIVRRPLPDDENEALRITLLTDLVKLSYPAGEEARLRKLLSELLSAAGRHEAAAREVFKAFRLAPKLPGLAETVELLREMGLE